MPTTPDIEGLFLVRWGSSHAALWQRRERPRVEMRCLATYVGAGVDDYTTDWEPDERSWIDEAVFTVLSDDPQFVETILVLDPQRVVDALRVFAGTQEWKL